MSMDSDLALILGLVIGFLAIPAIVSAYSDGRRPIAAILVLLIAAGLVAFAASSRPGGYRLAEIPDVFYTVVARFLN
ncbi:hypothetical protein ACFORG_08175 [Lutimaribacter marinistellae]|uniref:50S ribosomal protein L35 n=1 Tax=Lutimaribacter marinistellae TaxID=1820329 RepID=A0ABV7TFF0_9RHOB